MSTVSLVVQPALATPRNHATTFGCIATPDTAASLRAPFSKHVCYPGRDPAVPVPASVKTNSLFHLTQHLSPRFLIPHGVKDSAASRSSSLETSQIVLSSQFQVLFTLFSQFFSTFLRSTSSLSVFASYLGFDEVYHRFYAEFPIYATRKRKEMCEYRRVVTGLSPSLAVISITFHTRRPQPTSRSKGASETQITLSRPFPLTCSIFVRHYWWNLI